MEQSDDLKMHREDLFIEGDRKLYSYTFSAGEDHFGQLLDLADTGTADAVRSFLAAHPDTPLEIAGRAFTPLHFAAKRGQVETIRELASRGAPLGRKDAQHASTPLGWACYFGRPEAVQALLQAGAQVDENCIENAQGGIDGALAVPSDATKEDYKRVMAILKSANKAV